MQYPFILTFLFVRAGNLFPDVKIVSRMPDNRIHRHTYRDWYSRAKTLAAALQGCGIQRGDPVATLMWNHYAHLEAYFAVPVIGGVLHTLNRHWSSKRLAPEEIFVPGIHTASGEVWSGCPWFPKCG